MEGAIEKTIRLTGFAPLIQLWAGICLLFFYEILLKKFPLENNRKQTEKLFNDFAANYQGYVEPERMPQLENYLGTKWDDHCLPTIKNMASVSFFYSVFILACIGVEGTSLSANRIGALQVADWTVIAYMTIAILCTRWKIFHTYWTPVLYVIGLIVYYHVFPGLNDWMLGMGWRVGPLMSVTHVTVLTLFALASPLFLILLHLFYDWIVFIRRSRSFTRLNNDFDKISAVIIGMSKPADLPKKLFKKVMKKVSEDVKKGEQITTTNMKRYLEMEIKEEFDTFVTKWYARWWRKLANRVATSKVVVRLNEVIRTLYPVR